MNNRAFLFNMLSFYFILLTFFIVLDSSLEFDQTKKDTVLQSVYETFHPPSFPFQEPGVFDKNPSYHPMNDDIMLKLQNIIEQSLHHFIFEIDIENNIFTVILQKSPGYFDKATALIEQFESAKKQLGDTNFKYTFYCDIPAPPVQSNSEIPAYWLTTMVHQGTLIDNLIHDKNSELGLPRSNLPEPDLFEYGFVLNNSLISQQVDSCFVKVFVQK